MAEMLPLLASRASGHRYQDQLEATDGWLECVILTSSRFDEPRGLWKSSWHLRWPQIIVDKERAFHLRQFTIEAFEDASLPGGAFDACAQRLKMGGSEAVESLTKRWEDVFDITASGRPFGRSCSVVGHGGERTRELKQGTACRGVSRPKPARAKI